MLDLLSAPPLAALGAVARLVAPAALATALLVTPAGAMEIKKVTSPGGIEAWLVEDDTVPLVAMDFAFRNAGSAQDPVGKEGLANLLSSLLDEGAGDIASEAFQAKLADLAVKMSFDASRDAFTGELTTLAENRDAAFDLLRLAMTEPRFDPEPIARMKAQVVSGIRRNERDPEAIAGRLWSETAFPGHPYGRPTTGTESSVGAVGRTDLADFRRRAFARDNLVVAVVGAIDAKELGTLLDKTFGGLAAKSELATIPDVAPKSGGVAFRELPIPQTIIQFGGPGLKRDDPDFIPAFVMNHILGGGTFSSRLFEEIREKRGLAYGVDTYLLAYDHAGAFAGGTSTRADKAGETMSLIEKEVRRMADEGPTAAELAAAKRFLTGSYPLRFDTSGKIASQLLGIQLDNLGIDYVEKRNALIEAVTLEDVRRVAKRILDSGALTVVTVGPKAA
jgi:zinc protease